MKRSMLAFILGVGLAMATTVSAQDADTVEWLEKIAGLCEKQGHAPVPAAEIEAQLAKARAELQREQQKWREATQSPPARDNATGGMTAGWKQHLNDWKRRIDALEKRLRAAEERLRGCGAIDAGGPPAGAKPAGKPPVAPAAGPDVPTFDPRTHELKDGKVVPKAGTKSDSGQGAR